MNPYTIEQLSLKQWPAIQTINISGWQVRLANGFTKRANCVSVTDVDQTELQSYIENVSKYTRSISCRQHLSLHLSPMLMS